MIPSDATGCTDAVTGKGVRVADTLGCEAIQIWSSRIGITIATEMRADVFAADPQDVGTLGRPSVGNPVQRRRHNQYAQNYSHKRLVVQTLIASPERARIAMRACHVI